MGFGGHGDLRDRLYFIGIDPDPDCHRNRHRDADHDSYTDPDQNRDADPHSYGYADENTRTSALILGAAVRDEGTHRGMKQREGAGPRNRTCFLLSGAVARTALRLRILHIADRDTADHALGIAAVVR
jgi:hypothetical protein